MLDGMWIPAAVLIALAVLAVILVIVILRMRRKPEHTVVMSDGVDVETRRKGTDSGDLFQGTYDRDGTVAVGGRGRGTCRITLVNEATGEHYSMSFRQSMGIGRAEDVHEMENFLTIRNDSRVSRYHCRIFVNGGRLYIEDALSSNHTCVNEKQITGPYPLKAGDVIRVGNTRLKVCR